MKRTVFIVLCCGWLAVAPALVWGIDRPAAPLIPSYDKRQPAAAVVRLQANAQPVTTSALEQQAEALLQQRVPGVQVRRDALLGTPRLISSPDSFLTGPNGQGKALSATALAAFPTSDRHRLIKAFLNEHTAVVGHDARALDSARVQRDYVTGHNGLRTVIWEQTHAGIPVFQGVLQGHITAAGELAQLSSQFVPDVAGAATRGSANWSALVAQPTIPAPLAIAKAAADVGVAQEVAGVAASNEAEGADRKQQFRAPSLKGTTHAQLVWLPLDRSRLRLCWQVFFALRGRPDAFRSLVDAETGEVLVRQNLTVFQTAPTAIPGSYRVYTSDSPSPFSPGWPTPDTAQPPTVPRTLLNNLTALSATASPQGWLNPANANGLFETIGNNVDAHTDLEDDDDADLPRPSSNQNPPVFDFPLDLTLGPLAYTNASVVNLFYWCNFMHDRLYDLGFTEAAGNYQNNNFGRGGLGGDAIIADGQDGAALNDPIFHANNAYFVPAPDGIPGRIAMFVWDWPIPDRDGDLDAEIMIHEYTHGLSWRLVGGGVGLSALQPNGMGEGWSDFYALALLSEPRDDPNAAYAVGGYATYRLSDLLENYYFGIRRYPYSTDLNKNPLTFKDIDPTQADPHIGVPISPLYAGGVYAAEVHAQGEVWCAMLWQARANMVDAFGWDEGNRAILQLVTDGMKLCPPDPTFVEARDAILQADAINTGGAYRAELWRGFAARGLGLSALAPPAVTTIGVREAFDVPNDVITFPPDGILEVSVNPPNDATVLGGVNTPVFVRVRDGVSVTNAVVRGLLDGVTPITFNNNGAAPDTRARDSVYSGYLNAPVQAETVTLTLEVMAQGKQTATNTIRYFVAQLPPNDHFANAAKIRAEGALIKANNKYATRETPYEPDHAGEPSSTSSLWWTWTPTSDARVLVDSAGSRFQTLLAVYTGNSLTNLKELVSANGAPTRRQGYVFFDAKKGQEYRIAIASLSTNVAGQLNVRLVPGGQPDVTLPIVNVEAPINGSIVEDNVLNVTASAFDPDPLSSGIDRITFGISPISAGAAPAAVTTVLATGTTSTNAQLALVAGRNSITVTATDGAGNISAPVTITVTYRRRDPPNDHFTYAKLLVGTSGTDVISNAKATREPGEPRHADNDGGHSLWWTWQAPADGTLLGSTDGSTLDTVLGLYTGARVDSLTTVAFNDDALEGSRFSKLRHAVRADRLYYLAVDGFNGATGMVQLAYTFTPTNVVSFDLSASAGGRVSPAPGIVDVQANSTLTLTATPDENYEFAAWEGDLASSANPLVVQATKDLRLRAVFRPLPFSDDFETGGLAKLAWTTSGNLPWTVTDQTAAVGRYAARSGAIGHGQSSSLHLTGHFRAGAASFAFRVSSEPDYDRFQFYVDDVLQAKWSGEVQWIVYQFSLTAGTHRLEWRYAKDQSNSGGLDAAFIDNVDLPLAVPVDQTSAARLSLQQGFDGLTLVVQGQADQIYLIQSTSSFPPQWQTLSTNQSRFGEIRVPLGAGALGDAQRFYRAIVPKF